MTQDAYQLMAWQRAFVRDGKGNTVDKLKHSWNTQNDVPRRKFYLMRCITMRRATVTLNGNLLSIPAKGNGKAPYCSSNATSISNFILSTLATMNSIVNAEKTIYAIKITIQSFLLYFTYITHISTLKTITQHSRHTTFQPQIPILPTQ